MLPQLMTPTPTRITRAAREAVGTYWIALADEEHAGREDRAADDAGDRASGRRWTSSASSA